MVVQAKAPTGANSSIASGFAARVLDAKTPPYYHDADGDEIGAGEAEWYAPGDEPSGWERPTPTGSGTPARRL